MDRPRWLLLCTVLWSFVPNYNNVGVMLKGLGRAIVFSGALTDVALLRGPYLLSLRPQQLGFLPTRGVCIGVCTLL